MEEQELDQNKEAVKKDAKGLFKSLKAFLVELLDFREDTDREATVEAVRADIPFKGHIAWILIFSVFVASIGLNVSSTAVVIGAMLISPLMGPIVGIGLSVAINDGTMMRRSFINLGVMVALSVITAFIYFTISPIKEATPELEARTYPTILDVLIAIFGGFALIVAKTKKGTMASALFGVAIATALMPPLCTVGYGLAIGNFKFAGGAMYLFSINAVFIALATFIVAKLLKFPLVKYANQKKRKRVTTIATIVAVAVIAPSIFLFLKLLNVQVYETDASSFVENEMTFTGSEILKKKPDYDEKKIVVYFIGNIIPKNQINIWQEKLSQHEDERLASSQLIVHQGSDQSSALAEQLSSQVKSGILEDLYLKNQEALESKDAQIRLLEEQLKQLTAIALPFDKVGEEVKILYEGLDRFAYANMVHCDFNSLDTITTFKMGWSNSIPRDLQLDNNKKIGAWLTKRFSLDTLVIEEYKR